MALSFDVPLDDTGPPSDYTIRLALIDVPQAIIAMKHLFRLRSCSVLSSTKSLSQKSVNGTISTVSMNQSFPTMPT